MHVRFACLLMMPALLGTAAHAGDQPATQQTDNMSYLDNNVIRIGVNLDLGGAITFLSDSKKRINVVNSYDWGRQIQMSFYSGPQPYAPAGKQPSHHWRKLGWNPIQSGDFFGNRSRVIEHRNDGKALYVKCIPMHWPLDNEPAHCTFETWIELHGRAAHVRCRLNNARRDHAQYAARMQELPAVYVNGFLGRLMTYTGRHPFTDDKLTRITKRWGMIDSRNPKYPWDSWRATESWAAILDDHDWGLGIWSPGTYDYHGGFFGEPGPAGPKDASTGYISPRYRDILDHNIQYEYEYVLILGELKTIRAYVYERAERSAQLDYRFERDRRHWYYDNCTDAGWPIRGELHILPDGDRPRIISPSTFWRAEEAPKLYLHAAFHTGEDHATVYWSTFAGDGFDASHSLTFAVQPDGRYRRYEIDLSSSPAYTGAMIGLAVELAKTGKKGDFVKIKSIELR